MRLMLGSLRCQAGVAQPSLSLPCSLSILGGVVLMSLLVGHALVLVLLLLASGLAACPWCPLPPCAWGREGGRCRPLLTLETKLLGSGAFDLSLGSSPSRSFLGVLVVLV